MIGSESLQFIRDSVPTEKHNIPDLQSSSHNLKTRSALLHFPPLKGVVDRIAGHLGFRRNSPNPLPHFHDCFHRYGHDHPPPYFPHNGMHHDFHHLDKEHHPGFYPGFPNKHPNGPSFSERPHYAFPELKPDREVKDEEIDAMVFHQNTHELTPRPSLFPLDGMPHDSNNQEKHDGYVFPKNGHSHNIKDSEEPQGFNPNFPTESAVSVQPEHNFPNATTEGTVDEAPTEDKEDAKSKNTNDSYTEIPSHVYKKHKDEDYPVSDFDKYGDTDEVLEDLPQSTLGVGSFNFSNRPITLNRTAIVEVDEKNNNDSAKIENEDQKSISNKKINSEISFQDIDPTGWVTVGNEVADDTTELETTPKIDIRFGADNQTTLLEQSTAIPQ